MRQAKTSSVFQFDLPCSNNNGSKESKHQLINQKALLTTSLYQHYAPNCEIQDKYKTCFLPQRRLYANCCGRRCTHIEQLMSY